MLGGEIIGNSDELIYTGMHLPQLTNDLHMMDMDVKSLFASERLIAIRTFQQGSIREAEYNVLVPLTSGNFRMLLCS